MSRDTDALLDILERIELIEKHGPRDEQRVWRRLIQLADKTNKMM